MVKKNKNTKTENCKGSVDGIILETELFTAWEMKMSKKERTKEEIKDIKEGYEINYKGMKLVMTGFAIVKDSDSKVVCLYKMKYRDILFYTPSENSQEEKDDAYYNLSKIAKEIGFSVTNLDETLESVYQELFRRKENEQ